MTRKRQGRPTGPRGPHEAVTAEETAMAAETTAAGPPGPPAADGLTPAPDGAGADDGAASDLGPLGGIEAAVVAAFELEMAAALRRADEEKQRADESWDRYLRAEAELENFRRRAERQREEARFQARRELLARILEVGDNLERALGHSEAEPAQVVAGVEATFRELTRLLSREGVAPIEALDAPFDPALHEAVGILPVPGLASERVVSVERPGFTLNGELLRPARVIVGQPA